MVLALRAAVSETYASQAPGLRLSGTNKLLFLVAKQYMEVIYRFLSILIGHHVLYLTIIEVKHADTPD